MLNCFKRENGVMKNNQFTSSDAVLLLAIIYAKDSETSDLKGIIITGDFINHCIFTLQEINSGIKKLINAGFVSYNDNQFFPTKALIKKYFKERPRKGQVHKDLEYIEDILFNNAIDKNSTKESIIKITQSEFDNTIKEYQDEFNTMTNKFIKK